ncbi:arylsulfatase [Steroidobacter agaridevorans]|uniref:Arylsulfatase n=1 Tax=Steroidobacter agaridevorans TaxID=2695856 RepID=A0A829YL38_9GAMM|nr:arylsulfatase [Steroidobacter agaridevorans]GFE83573.1 arylsulfatase [Steroidobacter agaridevorans]
MTIAISLCLGCTTASSASKAPPRPNFIVILADDMGYSDISSYGGEIPTPNIDALAHTGMRFTQFYNNARCSPTRAALLTGVNPHQAGMGYLSGTQWPASRGTHGRLDDRAVTIAEVLKDAGYFTAMTGKWHLSNEPYSKSHERGFTRSLNAVAGGIYFADQPPDKGGKPRHLLLDGKKVPLSDPRLGEPGWYGTDLWTQWGIDYIEEARAEQRPFFLYLAHVAPHFPLMAPPEDVARFRGQYLAGWEQLRKQRLQRQVELGIVERAVDLPDQPSGADRWSELSPKDRERFDAMMAVYAAAVSRMDRSVGDLVAYLRRTGQLENTVILFLSDNGGNAESGPAGRLLGAHPGDAHSTVFTGMNWAMLQNTPFRAFKHFTEEGGIATPMIAHWPKGIAPSLRGSINREPSHVIDIAPTLYALAGVTPPREYHGHPVLAPEGRSFAPAFAGTPLTREQPLFWEHEGNRAVRDGRWKAVMRHMGAWQLYDLQTDPTELTDLAAAQPERLHALSAAWDVWAARTFVDAWPGGRRTEWGEALDRNAESKLLREGPSHQSKVEARQSRRTSSQPGNIKNKAASPPGEHQ